MWWKKQVCCFFYVPVVRFDAFMWWRKNRYFNFFVSCAMLTNTQKYLTTNREWFDCFYPQVYLLIRYPEALICFTTKFLGTDTVPVNPYKAA